MAETEVQQDEAARIAISVLQSEIEVLNCDLDRAYDYTVRLENQIKDAMNALQGR